MPLRGARRTPSAPRTRLVACSHVGWMSGSLAPAELAELDVPVLLDGAQGVGAIDVRRAPRSAATPTPAPGRSGCAAPTAPACSTSAPRCASASRSRAAATATSPTPAPASTPPLHEDARRFDTLALSAETRRLRARRASSCSSAGWAAVHERARTLAARLAELLRRARAASPRRAARPRSCPSPAPTPNAERARLADAGHHRA